MQSKSLVDRSIDRDTVKQMETVTISPKFQVVIPQKIREAMGLRSGEKAKVISFRNRIEIIPMREVRSLRGYLIPISPSY
jgi:AbrB family looped-hinge helix DNA binding protein